MWDLLLKLVLPFIDKIKDIVYLFGSVLNDYGVDCDTELQLLSDYEECTQPLINLLLAGRATTLLDNGTKVYDDNGKALVCSNAVMLHR